MRLNTAKKKTLKQVLFNVFAFEPQNIWNYINVPKLIFHRDEQKYILMSILLTHFLRIVLFMKLQCSRMMNSCLLIRTIRRRHGCKCI